MATAKQALEKLREICLSLPDTHEGGHFGDTAFYVKKKLFASCGDKHGVCEITFGLPPERAAALVKSDPRFRPYPRDKRGVVVAATDVTSWSELRGLIVQSYELQRPWRPPGKADKKPAPGKRLRR